MTKSSIKGFERPNLTVKTNEPSKFDAIAELKKEPIKRTNLSAPTALLNLIGNLKDYLMRTEGKKPTLEDLYFEALVDLVKKYHKDEGDMIFEDKKSFDRYFKMMFPDIDQED